MIYINGRFLQKPVTGTERFAREIVQAMDALAGLTNLKDAITILAPPGTPAPEGLKNIKFRTCGTRQGHAWEQWDLYRAASGGTLLSLTNSGPVLHRHQTVVIHDGAPYRMPKDFSLSYQTFHRILGRLLAQRSQIATVSKFSSSDLAALLSLDSERIPVFYNGHEHILRAPSDDMVIEKIGLQDRPYFLFIGSPAPRKNLGMAIKAFRALERSDIAFVIVGAANPKVFRESLDAQAENILMPGRLTDGEIVALYQHALALVFPSLYEGFGIPPLEAMVHGCPVLAADIPAVREVCGDAALYFSAQDTADCTRCLQSFLDDPAIGETLRRKGAARYAEFSWSKSAEQVLERLFESKLQGKSISQ